MFSPHKHTGTLGYSVVMDLLAELIMVIISHHVVYLIIMYNLNLHSVICQLYLNETGERNQ